MKVLIIIFLLLTIASIACIFFYEPTVGKLGTGLFGFVTYLFIKEHRGSRRGH